MDWARKKKIAFATEDGKVEKVAIKKLDFPKGTEIYVEAGFSTRILMRLMEKGCKVFRIGGKAISDFRGEGKKTDEGDAELIHKVYLQTPKAFTEIEKPTKSEFKLHRLMAKYRQVTKDVASFKNRVQAMEWEYGKETYGDVVARLEKLQDETFKRIEPIVEYEYRKLKHIKGLGPKTLAKLLASAHPRDFESLSAYLAYCGCKASSFYKKFEDGKGKGRGEFSRNAKSAIWFIAKSCMTLGKKERTKYYCMYEKLRKDLEARGLKKLIHTKALNRLQTFLLKEIYHTVKDIEPMKSLEEVFEGW